MDTENDSFTRPKILHPYFMIPFYHCFTKYLATLVSYTSVLGISDSNNINLLDNAEMKKFTRLVATVKCVLGMRPIWLALF